MLQAGAHPDQDRAEAVADVGAGSDQCPDAPTLGGVGEALLGHDVGVEGDVQGVHGGSFPEDATIVRAYHRAIN